MLFRAKSIGLFVSLLGICVLMQIVPVACSTPSSMDISLYYHPDIGPFSKEKAKVRYSIYTQEPFSRAGQETGFVPLDTLPSSLKVIDCDKELPEAEQEAAPNIVRFPTFMYLEIHLADGRILAGRARLRDICNKKPVSILMAPLETLSPLGVRINNVSKSDTASGFARIGSQITPLPNGKYLISGGFKEMTTDFETNQNAYKGFVTSLAIWDPMTGIVSYATNSQKETIHLKQGRAFHQVIVNKDGVIFLGGFTTGQEIAEHESFAFDGESLRPDDLHKKVAYLKPRRAFQKVFSYEKDGELRYVEVGGVTCSFKDIIEAKKAECKDQTQLMYYTAGQIDNGEIFLVGGRYFDHADSRWRTHKEVRIIQKQDFGKFVDFKETSKHPMSVGRAGHAMIQLGEEEFLILGGYESVDRDTRMVGLSAPNALFDSKFAEILSTKDWKTALVTMEGLPKSKARVYSKGVSFEHNRMLLFGGLEFLGEGCIGFAPDALSITRESARKFKVEALPQEERVFHQVLRMYSGQIVISGGAEYESVNQTHNNVVFHFHNKQDVNLFNPDPEQKQKGTTDSWNDPTIVGVPEKPREERPWEIPQPYEPPPIPDAGVPEQGPPEPTGPEPEPIRPDFPRPDFPPPGDFRPPGDGHYIPPHGPFTLPKGMMFCDPSGKDNGKFPYRACHSSELCIFSGCLKKCSASVPCAPGHFCSSVKLAIQGKVCLKGCSSVKDCPMGMHCNKSNLTGYSVCIPSPFRWNAGAFSGWKDGDVCPINFSDRKALGGCNGRKGYFCLPNSTGGRAGRCRRVCRPPGGRFVYPCPQGETCVESQYSFLQYYCK